MSQKYPSLQSGNSNFIKNTTPRKCKNHSIVSAESQMKKASSLHDINKLGNLKFDEKESNDSDTEKEKNLEEQTSDLYPILQSLRKDNESILLENNRLTETVKNLQMLVNRYDGNGGDHPSIAFATMGDCRSELSDFSSEHDDIDNGDDTDGLKTLSMSTLQERIQKMEEDRYCATEEIQATMSELEDLKHSLESADVHNQSLHRERALLIASLCEQTEKLKKCRQVCDTLKQLLSNGSLHNYDNIDEMLYDFYKKLNQRHTDEESRRYIELEDKYRDERLQREQVQELLVGHNELIDGTIGWTDCKRGVLRLIEQINGQKRVEVSLKSEVGELTTKVRQLEETMGQTRRHKNERRDNLEESEREIEMLGHIINSLRQKYADDIIVWRAAEQDLLMAIVASTSINDEKDKSIHELQRRLELSDQRRKELEESMKGQKSETMEHAMVTHDHNSSTHECSVQQLIQVIERQMETKNSTTKPNHVNEAIPVRAAITRTNTLQPHSVKKSATFKTEFCQRQEMVASELKIVPPVVSILNSVSRRNSLVINPISHCQSLNCSRPESPQSISNDPLTQLVKRTNRGSKRNALLYWCQQKTNGYQNIDITNFSSSWDDGLALCALLHSLEPSLVDFKTLADAMPLNPDKVHKRNNFQAAFAATEKLGIKSVLDTDAMVSVERPNWSCVMNHVVEIFMHFETRS